MDSYVRVYTCKHLSLFSLLFNFSSLPTRRIGVKDKLLSDADSLVYAHFVMFALRPMKKYDFLFQTCKLETHQDDFARAHCQFDLNSDFLDDVVEPDECFSSSRKPASGPWTSHWRKYEINAPQWSPHSNAGCSILQWCERICVDNFSNLLYIALLWQVLFWELSSSLIHHERLSFQKRPWWRL